MSMEDIVCSVHDDDHYYYKFYPSGMHNTLYCHVCICMNADILGVALVCIINNVIQLQPRGIDL